MSDIDRLAAAADWRDAPLAIATVIATWGSAPRPCGSHMLVLGDGASRDRFRGAASKAT